MSIAMSDHSSGSNSRTKGNNWSSHWDFYRTEKEIFKSRRRTEEWTLPMLRRLLKSSGKACRVLSLGCGSAVDVAVLREHGLSCRGTDLDPSCWEPAKGVFIQSEAERLPFKTGAFDALVSLEMIEHIGTPPGVWKPTEHSKITRLQVVAEMGRVVKPNGVIILATPNRLFPIDEHGPGKSQLRFHLPFRDLTLSYFELKRLFAPHVSEIGIPPHGRYFALKKIERLFGPKAMRMVSSVLPLFSNPILHACLFNPHLFLYFRTNGRAGA